MRVTVHPALSSWRWDARQDTLNAGDGEHPCWHFTRGRRREVLE
jgi:hypothetical protein